MSNIITAGAAKSKAHFIIHSHATAAAGVAAGLAQVPFADTTPLCAIEISMAKRLGEVFGVTLTKSTASGLIGSIAATAVGKTAARTLLGLIPGYGNAVKGSVAAASVEALGWSLYKHFKSNNTIESWK